MSSGSRTRSSEALVPVHESVHETSWTGWLESYAQSRQP
jgi:hypothetical protein